MPRYTFAKAARAHLLDELVAAGLPATTLVEMDGGDPDYVTSPGTTCWVTCPAAQYATAAQVVAAHDPAALDALTAKQQQVVKNAWQTLSAAATTDQTMQAIKVLFRYINSQLT